MTKQEYTQWTQEESPKSKGPMNILKAFVFGGGICAIGQLLVFFYQSRGAGELGFCVCLAFLGCSFRCIDRA